MKRRRPGGDYYPVSHRRAVLPAIMNLPASVLNDYNVDDDRVPVRVYGAS